MAIENIVAWRWRAMAENHVAKTAKTRISGESGSAWRADY